MTVLKTEYGVRKGVIAYMRDIQRKELRGSYIVFFCPLLIFMRQVYPKQSSITVFVLIWR